MRTSVVVLVTALALALVWGSSCGGIAVVDGGGASNDASGSGSGSGAAQPGPGPAGPGSSSSGLTGDDCVDACNLIGACYEPSGCVDGCRAVPQACTTQRGKFIQCLFDELNPAHPCDLPDPCIVPLDAFTACLGLKPFGGFCTQGNQSCSCNLNDGAGNVYDTSCDALEFSTCTCSLNGAAIGTCTTPGFDQCNPLDDCCATLFFVPGQP